MSVYSRAKSGRELYLISAGAHAGMRRLLIAQARSEKGELRATLIREARKSNRLVVRELQSLRVHS